MLARCRRLTAWLVLLTLLCQSTAPCCCVQCGFAGAVTCCEACQAERDKPTGCRHAHRHAPQDPGALEPAEHSHCDGHDHSGPVPTDAPCSKGAVIAAVDAASVRTELTGAGDALAPVLFVSDRDVLPGRAAALRAFEPRASETPCLAQGARLQV